MTEKKLTGKLTKLATKEKVDSQKAKVLGDIAQMLERKNISLDDIGTIQRVSLYQSLTKNEEGEAEVHDLVALQFSPAFEDGPKWPVVQPGPSIQVPKVKGSKKPNKGFKTCVIVPDIQIGYFRNAEGKLEPTHDERAISIALQIIEDLNPELIVCVGDNLDLPEMGKYLTYPSFQQTTQASIDAATTLCAQMRAAAPNAVIKWLAGNHEERLPKYLLVNAAAAYGLRKGNTPKDWPVMTVPYLCRMEEYGVDFLPGYPASHYWINEKLRVIHGDRVNSSGVTATRYLNNEKVSVLYGHIHRIEMAYKTREDFDGARTVMAASAGCLARIDGAIPSTKGGVDLDGRPLVRHEDWQHGLGVVTYEDKGEHRFSYETVHIYNGWGQYRGTEYKG
jgi:hypothetical protein